MEAIPEGRANERSAATAGAWLRNARQQRGLHIAALAVMLKVPQAKLEALEADRYDELPDATFARALATAVCRALKIDAGPVLALLPRSSASEFDMRPGLNQPFRERSGGTGGDGSPWAVLARPIVWGPALLVVIAAVIYWIPASWLPERSDASGSSAASGAFAASAPPAEFVAAPLAASPPDGVASSAAVSAEPVASAPVQVRDVPAPPGAVVSAPSVPTTGAGPALRVTAVAETWIEVVDGKGQTLLSRVMREGEQQEYSGAPPYKVRVGNVRGTKVEWRDAVVDLAARTTSNVARVELN